MHLDSLGYKTITMDKTISENVRPSISLDIKEFFKDKHEFGGSKMFAP
jgi:hypothetical protein